MLAVAVALLGTPVSLAATAGAASAVTTVEPAPGHPSLVPQTPRRDTPVISDGEVFDIEVAGNRVFIAGSFSSIQDTDGTTIDQRSLVAYDINTGRVDTGFRPVFDGGGVAAVEASPDGSAVYVTGSFNSVNGVGKRRIARLDPTTGAPVPGFTANASSQGTALAVSDTAVYVGGKFSSVNGVARSALAALDPATGAVDPQFDLPLSGGIGVNGALTVQQLKLTSDGSKLLVVHTGRQIAGQDRYGVGIIDTAGKALLPWRTRLWEDNLAFVGGIQRIYGGDIAPDGSYFVVTSGSGGDRPPINDTAMAFPMSGGDNVEPRWVSRHFDSVYSVAITEKAVYVGGHFSFQESPTAPVPWPGLDNVGYGTGQGLSGYSLGDSVVRRDHLGALDPATGTAVEWNPGFNSYEGVKAMEETPRGLFVGGDGMWQGGVRTGRVGFYDFAREPAPSAVDTTIDAPIEGRVVTADEPFSIQGRATAPAGVSRVSVQILNTDNGQWLQDDLTSWGSANTITAQVDNTGATSATWSLGLTLTGNNAYSIYARAVAGDGQSDPVRAVKKIESFGVSDQTPTTAISSPPSGLVTSRSFVATGTATDDVGVNALTYYFQDGNGRYLQDDGTVASAYNSFRGEPDVVGAPNATWQYEVNLPNDGAWTMGATAVDTAGQSDLRAATRDWVVSQDGTAPEVTVTAPARMVPPGTASSLTVRPGSPVTFSGTARADGNLANVEIYLRNTSTRESLASDGTWSKDSVPRFYRISPLRIGATSYDWSYTTPFDLSPGVYDFRVRATDETGLTTASANQGLLSVTAQYPNDAFPNGLLSFTGVDQNVDVLRLDLSGSATDDKGVTAVRVALRDLDSGRYVQPDGTMAAGFATLDATLASPGATSTNFTLPVDLPTQGEYSVEAWAVDTSGQQDSSTVGATARYLVYPGDLDPWLSDTLSSPADGTSFTEARIVVSGRAFDDTAMGKVEVAVVNAAGQYLGATGTFASTLESWRPAFLNSPGSPGSNYSYTSPVIPNGTYTVKVRAVDGYGQVQQTPKSVTVTVSAPSDNAPPVASPTVSCTQNVCAFDGRGSTDESPTSLTYAWDFGNAKTSTAAAPTVTYTAAGTYPVTLVVSDVYGATASATLSVTITEPPDNAAPTPVLSAPTCDGQTCVFSASGSADPNPGDSLTYAWDFGDGTAVGTAARMSHTYAAAGTYPVRLTVTDGWGKSSSTTRSVTVGTPVPGNTAPTAAFTQSCSGLACGFDGTGSADPDAGDAVASYAWDFGDGTTGTGARPSHNYAAGGTFTVTLTVQDGGGATGSTSRQVAVTAPTASAVGFRGQASRTGNLVRPSVAVPANVAAGDTLLMYLAINRSTTISNPPGWTVVGSRNSGQAMTTRVWSRTATATDPGRVIRVTLGASAKFTSTIAAYTNVDPSVPVAAATSASETTVRATHTTPTVAGARTGSRLLSYWADKTSATTNWQPPAGQAARAEVIGTGTGRVTSLLTDGPGGDGGLTATANASTSRAVMWSLLLNPAPAAP